MIKSYLFFYSKILIPTVCISIGVSLMVGFSFKSMLLSYSLFSIMLHYIMYELVYPTEYYFFYNLGFTKAILWSITLAINAVLAVFLLF